MEYELDYFKRMDVKRNISLSLDHTITGDGFEYGFIISETRIPGTELRVQEHFDMEGNPRGNNAFVDIEKRHVHF
jgi:hypothetical protein